MTSRKAYLLGLLSLLFLPTQSPGQVGYTTDEMVTGDASGTLYSAVVPLAFPRSYIFARGDFGDRPGVLDNYFSTGGFMPMQFHGPDEVFYIEGQVWLTEQNEKSLVGGNFGVGNRWLIKDYSQMIGVNAFLSWDQKGSGFNYDGVGVGAEWLSDYLGVTVNGYIPWNRRINEIGPATPIKEMTHFTGTNLAFVTLQPVEEQLAGGDIEVGSAIPRAEWLSLFAGAYAFDADQGNDFTGISGRAQLDFTSAIVNIGVYDDDRFGTSVNVTGELRLGDGPLDFTPRHRTLDNQMFDRARRQARIQTLQYIAQGEEIAINPANGLPFEFLHVDNTAAPGGDGSFEMRFDELDDASNMPIADIILAYRGDTSFGGTHLDANGGLVLEDNQIVVGEGYPFLLETANFPGLLCPLPDFGDGGANPFIDGNAGANLITLANNNQILGLNLLAPTGGNGIVGTDITDTVIDEINRDVIFGVENTGDGGGILLTNIGGTADITNIGFEITDPASAGGIIIDNTNTADLTLNINNDLVEFPGLVVMGGQTGIGISADASNITADIDNINNSESETGIAFVGRNAADITAIVDNSDFTNSTGDGMVADLDDASTATAMFTDGSFADSGDGAGDNAIDILLAGGSSFDLVLDNTSGNNAFDDGIFGSIDDGSDLMIVATDSTFSGAQNGDGLDIDAFMGSTFNGTFTDGSFADAMMGNGITLDFDGMGTTGVLTLDNVPLDNAGLNALEVIADNNAVVTVTGDEVSGAGAGADGINLNADNTAMIGVMLTNTGSFAGANDDGVDLTNANGGVIILDAQGDMAMPVDFSGVTTGNGLVSTATGANTRTDIDFGTGANFDNSAIDAINITSNTGAVTTLDGTDVSGDSAGDDGIQLSSNAGMIGLTITEAGSFANAGSGGGGTGDGIDIFNEAGGQIVVNLSGDAAGIIDFSGAERHGLVSDTDGNGTTTTINLNTGAMFDMAGEDAINLTSTNMGFTELTGTMVSGSSAGDDGIDLNNDAGFIDLQLTNTGSFADAGQNLAGFGDGIDSVNNNGGITAINISGAGGMPVDFSGAEADGLFASTGLNATTDIDFNTGAMFDMAGIHAIHLEANDAASVTLDGDNVSGSMAGADAILVNAENSAGVMSTGVDVNLTNTGSFAGAGGDGLEFNGTDSADLNINISGTAMTPADFSGAADEGVNGFLDASMAILTLTNTNFNGPLGGDGMNIDANNGSVFTGNITDSTFNDATMGDGIEANIDGSMGTLNLTNVDANDAGDNALMLRADDTMALGASILDVNLNTVNLNDAVGGDAINAIAMDGGFIDIDGTDVNGMDAGGMGVQLSANASRIDFTLGSTGTNNFTNSGSSGLFYNGVAGSVINIDVSDTNFDDTAMMGMGIGLHGSLTDSEANVDLTNVTFNNAGAAGSRSFTDNALLTGTWDNVEFNDAAGDAIFFQSLNGSVVDMTMSNISGLNAGDDGFDIIADGVDAMTMTDVNIQIDDSDFTNATNNGLEVDFQNFANVVFNSDNGLILDDAGQSAAIAGMGDGVNLFGDTSAFADIDITNGSVLNAFDDMTDAVMIMGGAVGMVTIDPTTATGAGDNGLEFDVDGGILVFTLGDPMGPDPDSPLSTAMDPVGNNGVLGTIDNGGTATLNFNNSDITSDGSSTGDGINVTGMNASTLNLNLNNSDVEGWSNGSGLELMAMGGSTFNVDGNNTSFDDAGDFGIDAQALSGSTLSINLDTFSADNAGTGGINLVADGAGSSIIGSSFANGTTQNSGSMGMDGSFGISVTATNGGEVGDSGAMSSGITFSNVDSGNTDFMALTQDNGLIVDVDDDAFVSMIFDDVNMNANEFDGVIVNVNEPDASMDDGSFANLAFINGSEINNNGGNGFTLNATNGLNPDPMNPTAGIELLLMDSFVNGNANSFMQPVDPMAVPDPGNDPDEIGFGVVANADNNIITVNFDNTDLDDNEEGSALANPTNGGIVNFNFANMTIFDPVQICADSGGFASTMLTNVIIENITGDNAAISMHAETGGTAQGIFNNVTIRDVEAQAFAFLAETGGTVIADFNGLTVERAAQGPATMDTKTGLMVEAVLQGRVETGGMADIDYGNVNISDDDMTDTPVNAIQTNVVTAGILDLQIDGLVVTDTTALAGEGEVETTVDGAMSTATIDFNDINVDGSDGRGINIESTGGGTFSITQLNNISAQNAQEEGLNIAGDVLDNGMAMTPTAINISNSNFSGAGQGGIDDGVNLDLSFTGDSELNITDVTADNATSRGLDINVNVLPSMANLDINITGDAMAGTSSFDNAGSEGISVIFSGAGDSTGTVDISNTSATGAMGLSDGIELFNLGTTDITAVNIDNVDVSGAGDDGLEISLGAQTSPVDITINDLIANDTGDLGLLITLGAITGGDTTVNVTNVTANNNDIVANPGGGGIDIGLTGVTGGTQTINVDNVSAMAAQHPDAGLNIELTGLLAGDTGIIDVTGTGGMNNFSNAAGDGVNIDIDGAVGSMGTVSVHDVIANDVGLIGVDVNVTGGITADLGSTFDNITAMNAGEEGLEISSDAASTITAIRGMNNNFDNAGQSGMFDGISLDIAAQAAPIDIEFTDTTANNATLGGVDINLASISGDSSIILSNVDATGAQGADGLNIDATLAAMANLDVTIDGGMGGISDFSGAAGDGVDIDIAGNGTNTIGLSVDGVTASNTGGDGFNFGATDGQIVNISNFANVTTTGNDQDGIEFTFDDLDDMSGATVTFDPMGTFQNIVSMMNNENGLLFNIDNGSTVAPVVIDGFDLSLNSVTSTTDAGLQINVLNGSSADFTFDNLTIDNQMTVNTGRGVVLNVQDTSTLDFAIGGVSQILDTGREGVDIEVGTMVPGATFNGDFSGLTIARSGRATLINDINGFDVDVAGAGSTATIDISQTTSNENIAGDGFNFIVSDAGALAVSMSEVQGNNNFESGLEAFATGAGTDFDLILTTPMMGMVNTFNSNGLIDPPNNDGGHGLEVRLEDMAMATLNLESSTSLNAGDGIRVTTDDSGVMIDDLGIAAGSISVDDNGGNGLTINLDSVIGVDAIDLSGLNVNDNIGDQISIMLTDMMLNSVLLDDVVADGLGAGMGMGNGIVLSLDNTDILMELGLTNVQAVNNGLDGLLLELIDGSTIPAGSAIDTAVSMTNQDAQFDNNGQHGINILLDDSAAELDILNSLAPFARTSSMSGNGGSGLNVVLRNASDLDMNVDGQDIIGNGDIGTNFSLNESSVADLEFGATGMLKQNIIDDNVYAGIGIELFGTSQLTTLNIQQTAVTNTTLGADAAQLALGYTGDGLRVITNAANDFATDTRVVGPVIGGMDPMTPNTEFSNNVGRGIVFEANLDSRVTDPVIRNSLINDNGSNGIEFSRLSNSLLDDVLISGNQINDNGGLNEAGINLILQGGAIDISDLSPLTIDFTIMENEINNNGGRGVNFELNADVMVNADIMDNDIFESGQEAIRVRAEDDSVLDGIWMDNFLRDSGQAAVADGINVTAMDRVSIGANTGLLIDSSEISGSSGDGIELNASATNGVAGLPALFATIEDNQQQNVNDTRGIFMNAADGINLVGASVSTLGVVADRNVIRNNGSDGISATRSTASTLVLTAEDNLIQQNSQHGVNLNTSGTDATGGLSVTLTDNEVVQNVQRGVSLVNTDDADSFLTIEGTVDPTPAGVGATSRIEQNGEIGVYIENNSGGLLDSNDIVLDIFDTSIVGNGANVMASDDNRNGVWIRVGTSSFGTVLADVQRNYFSGNGTIDFVTESFIATPDPTTDNPYDANGIASSTTYDPLARLALNLVDNVGDTIDVTRFGAFYNNQDEFKSPAAFFNSETRRRNAQRTAVDFEGGVLTSSGTFAQTPPVGSTDPFNVGSTVGAAPAPTTTTFVSTTGEGVMPRNTFEGLGVRINGATRYISAYNAGNNQITVTPALGGAPAAADPFVMFARNISGVGQSTFRTAQSSVTDDGNVWGLVITDFTDAVLLNGGNPDAAPLFSNSQTFTWEINDPDAPNYIFP